LRVVQSDRVSLCSVGAEVQVFAEPAEQRVADGAADEVQLETGGEAAAELVGHWATHAAARRRRCAGRPSGQGSRWTSDRQPIRPFSGTTKVGAIEGRHTHQEE
jgi:hypothetical protein